MNKDLYNSTVKSGKCELRSSDQMHLNNITFDAEIVTDYAKYVAGEMDDILFGNEDDSELVQLIQMHEIALMSIVKMN